mmetsp:Transcript_107824/g.150403  ORF Transcript_107824/g.150403 Transcript_107824/m.150403 type:complete len:225 (-) Transcript_107824:54-728(-)
MHRLADLLLGLLALAGITNLHGFPLTRWIRAWVSFADCNKAVPERHTNILAELGVLTADLHLLLHAVHRIGRHVLDLVLHGTHVEAPTSEHASRAGIPLSVREAEASCVSPGIHVQAEARCISLLAWLASVRLRWLGTRKHVWGEASRIASIRLRWLGTAKAHVGGEASRDSLVASVRLWLLGTIKGIQATPPPIIVAPGTAQNCHSHGTHEAKRRVSHRAQVS